MVKFTILLKRNAALSQAEFIEHYRTKHAQLVLSIPAVQQTVKRLVQQHPVPGELLGMPPAKYDGITELWFDDVEALGKCFSDPEYLERAKPDEAFFLDVAGCDFMISEEHIVI